MPGLERSVVREPGADSPRDYAQRVHRLAIAFVVLFELPAPRATYTPLVEVNYPPR
jgi:hypothetical protein